MEKWHSTRIKEDSINRIAKEIVLIAQSNSNGDPELMAINTDYLMKKLREHVNTEFMNEISQLL